MAKFSFEDIRQHQDLHSPNFTRALQVAKEKDLGGHSRSPAHDRDNGRGSVSAAGPSHVLAEQMEVEDLRLQLLQKEDEIAMLVHFSNTESQVPITADLAERLTAAVALSAGGHGDAFRMWLKDMADERHRMAKDRQAQAENASLLVEAREALAQLIVLKVQEAQDGVKDLNFLSDALDEGAEALEMLVSKLSPCVHSLQSEAARGEVERADLQSQLRTAMHHHQSEARARGEEEAAATAAADALQREQAVTKALRRYVCM
jgi:hypothetical protein